MREHYHLERSAGEVVLLGGQVLLKQEVEESFGEELEDISEFVDCKTGITEDGKEEFGKKRKVRSGDSNLGELSRKWKVIRGTYTPSVRKIGSRGGFGLERTVEEDGHLGLTLAWSEVYWLLCGAVHSFYP